jgi:dihydrofolate reductase
MTRVHIVAEGDTYFPELNWGDWSLVQDKGVVTTSDQGLEYSFLVYERELTWSPEASEGSRGAPGAR